MKFLVFGAGYVGKALLKASIPSCVFSATTTSSEKVASLQEIAKEIFVLHKEDRDAVKHLLDSFDGMGVFVAPGKEQSYEECYLETARAISASLKGRTKPFYLLYTSSTSVYEGQTQEWVSEELALNPVSEKTQTLAETEKVYLGCANQNISVCILRLAGIYGPGRELSARAKHFSGKKMTGSGNEPTNHIHLNDIVCAIRLAILNKFLGIFNIACDEHPSRQELYSTLCKKLDLAPPQWDSLALGSGYKVANDKIKSCGLNFQKLLI